MTLTRLLRICQHRLQSLLRKERLDDQLDEELAFHFDQLVMENLDAGMNIDVARRHARRTLGNFAVIREECRDERGVTWFHDFRKDLRYGFRMMREHAGLTAIAAIALAIVIGANAAILSVGNALRRFDAPFPNAERLVTLGTHRPPIAAANGLATIPDYLAWKDQTHEFESMGASMPISQDLAAEESGVSPERISGQAVTPSLFHTLGVQPFLGRVFVDEELVIGGPPARTVVLSHGLWQRRFGGDPQVLGRQMRLDGRSLTVIGVMPPGFWYPDQNSQYWALLGISPAQIEGSAKIFLITARMKHDATLEQAQAGISGVASRLNRDFPERHKDRIALTIPLKQHWLGWLRQPLLMLASAAVLGMLIACANVSILLLRHVPARRPEISLRVMMGAGRGRIIRQFLTESLLLAVIGGGLGLLVAWFTIQSLWGIQTPPGRLPVPGIGDAGSILGFTALLSVIAAFLFGLMPTRAAVLAANEFRNPNADETRRRPASLLISAQVALALALLVPAGLLMNSFVRLLVDDRGFDPRGVLTFNYRIPALHYASPSANYYGLPAMKVTPPTPEMQRVYESLRNLPGSVSIAASSAPPVNGVLPPNAVLHVEGKRSPATPAERSAATTIYFLVTENFFRTLKTPIVRGRDFNETDDASTPWVAVINETLARRLWPGENPIGKHFTVDAVSGEREREVVGVVRDVPLQYVHYRQIPIAYTLYRQQPEKFEGWNAPSFGSMTFFIRTDDDPMSLVPSVRKAVAGVDPDRPPVNFQPMAELVGKGMRTRGFYVSMLGLFAFMATVLAATSIYGVVTFASQSARALGTFAAASGGTLRYVAAGVIVGIGGAFGLTRLIEPQLWGVTATDPPTFAAVTALLVTVSVAACFIPARRALRGDVNVSSTRVMRHS